MSCQKGSFGVPNEKSATITPQSLACVASKIKFEAGKDGAPGKNGENATNVLVASLYSINTELGFANSSIAIGDAVVYEKVNVQDPAFVTIDAAQNLFTVLKSGTYELSLYANGYVPNPPNPSFPTSIWGLYILKGIDILRLVPSSGTDSTFQGVVWTSIVTSLTAGDQLSIRAAGTIFEVTTISLVTFGLNPTNSSTFNIKFLHE